MQFGNTPRLPLPVFNGDFHHSQTAVKGEKSHFRFQFKSVFQNGAVFHKKSAERPVTGHYICDPAMKKELDHAPHGGITETVERAFVHIKIIGGKAVADHHFRRTIQNGCDELRRGGSGVSIIGIHHQIAIGIHIQKHFADYGAFPLNRNMTHNGSVFRCDCRAPVGAVVVINIDLRIRQHGTEIADHLPDSRFLVITRQQYCYFFHFFRTCSFRILL